jgi:predicted O-methyltransferase YrrM
LIGALIEGGRLEEAKDELALALADHPSEEALKALSEQLAREADEHSVENYVRSVFEHLLFREPKPQELADWMEKLRAGLKEREFYYRILNHPDYGKRPRVVPGHVPGHYYSPIADPAEVEDYWKISASLSARDLTGIALDLTEMREIWAKNAQFMKSLNFTEKPGGASRYYYDNEIFHNGDAIILAGMLNHFRPKRVIEIGSGMSSASMLDAVEQIGLQDFRLTCIEPYANRLRSLLREGDRRKVDIVEKNVQDVDVNLFAELEAGDILFIDSSHVMKAGSDVHYEIFYALPALKPGVIMHVHDIQFPFEHPRSWVLDFRWAWNEIYAMRAFLMHNPVYRIFFFNDYFLREHPELAREVAPGSRWPLFPLLSSSLWIEKRDPQRLSARDIV